MSVAQVADEVRDARQNKHDRQQVQTPLRSLRQVSDDDRGSEKWKRLEAVRFRSRCARPESLLLPEPNPRVTIVVTLTASFRDTDRYQR